MVHYAPKKTFNNTSIINHLGIIHIYTDFVLLGTLIDIKGLKYVRGGGNFFGMFYFRYKKLLNALIRTVFDLE